MTPQSPEQLIGALRWRYATKEFDAARRISPELWEAVEDSLVLAPSSFGLQPWKFIVVKDPGLRMRLREQSWNQPQVTDASHLVVMTARRDMTAGDIDAWVARLAEVNGKEPGDFEMLQGMIVGFNEAMSTSQRHEWNKRQVYLALGQLLASAAVLGIDACPLEGISPSGYDEILGLTGGPYATVVACALGYRTGTDKYASAPKARFEKSRVVETR